MSKSIQGFVDASKRNLGMVGIIGISMIVLILLMVIWWIYSKLTLDKANCKQMNNLYKDFPLMHTINISNEQFSHKLRDYYIKTAYNCCSSGNFKNDFVNICALKNCIKQGVRCLDFEIYSIDNKPVISVSSQNVFDVKEAYNSVSFSNAMSIISD